ncbi:DUF3048 domain-containing protein [uncultured Eubacterium sp.]|uniref:DUF3048 domain-containing protein n=1 Tax=uncultured Eubacterium sp. TaxID=165185 RepID=UPI002591744F|nr:DUF3048 domain-containing protein [uncultured Eubacterium sp.]
MKKAIAMILLGVMSLSLLAGCGKKEETPVVSDSAQETSISVPEEEPVSEPEIPAAPEGMARSYLTGEWIDEAIANQRPLAVMLGNTKIATPQYGITDADVIYEAAVEGQETRLMAIFQDYANLEKVMSIRSCRHYYVHWALEFDAIYAHYGQAKYAVEILSQDYVNNLSGLDGGVEKVMYKRDSNRKAPHNAYTTGEGIVAGIAYKGYETQHAADYSGHYKFVEDDDQQLFLQGGSPAAVVEPGYLVNKPWFVFDSETGLYKRFQNGAAQTDGNNGKQVEVKNIIIQICEWNRMSSEDEYLNMETMKGGSGYYITNGTAIPVTWKKDSLQSPTRYYKEDGSEIQLNQGKTWVCVTEDTYADKIAFYPSEEEYANR